MVAPQESSQQNQHAWQLGNKAAARQPMAGARVPARAAAASPAAPSHESSNPAPVREQAPVQLLGPVHHPSHRPPRAPRRLRAVSEMIVPQVRAVRHGNARLGSESGPGPPPRAPRLGSQAQVRKPPFKFRPPVGRRLATPTRSGRPGPRYAMAGPLRDGVAGCIKITVHCFSGQAVL